ncbi:FecR family protein [Colwellia psychrerythraea]|uniref:Anti-FecI sigma factor, FecR n=1 Tax=Colwellia psychrerythraea TaxID=28229 RepID=A0A099KQ00_COLPS|nr:FecR domain-containing protein [Colwellia psychrerythraea]KGJ92849.1 anti-FecI sigma factor, FecR [Colwellia psychrerythraea]
MGNVSQLFSNNSNQQKDENNIQELACLWISRMDRGLTTLEQQQLVIWCNQNTQHHSSLLEMASYWDDLSLLNELSALFPLEQVKEQSKRNKFTSIALAASITIVSLISVNTLIDESFLPFLPSFNEQTLTQTQILQTQVGEQTSFTLKDGSQIQLNTNSQVEVKYSPKHRLLTLVRGEARFDVAKDKNRPFTVTVGKKSFTALGTIFNVQKNNNQIMELVVTEGKVLITEASTSITDIQETLTQARVSDMPDILAATLVVSGEKAIIAKDSPSVHTTPVEKVSLDQIHRDLAWQQGMLIFEGEPLSVALTEISRYTTSNFEIVDNELANINVAGYFKAGDIDGLLISLESNFGINFRKKADGTILLSAAN